ncbi:MAG: hypothetical protein KJ630_10755 [Proteobacteria bacterium]|nr:hypothetical protein [Pseudomonadota bacterium]
MPQLVLYRNKVGAWAEGRVVRAVVLEKAKEEAKEEVREEVVIANRELVYLRMPAE